MDTPRSILEAYAGGDYVDGGDLKAAAAWMLSAWESVMAAAADICQDPKKRSDTDSLDKLLGVISNWDYEISDNEIDVSATVAMPSLVVRHQNIFPQAQPKVVNK